MMVFSHGRVRPNHRHSVLELDITAFHDGTVSPECSTSSFRSGSSSSHSSRGRTSYNSRILHNIKANGLRITAEDVYQLRREIQNDYCSQSNSDGKRSCLAEALETLAELRIELREEAAMDHASLPFFLFEYQALVCWIYSTIRFAPFMSEMAMHFLHLKEEHREMLDSLRPRSESFLRTILRFCQLCLEYAPYCDQESLQWCQSAVISGVGRRKCSMTSARGSRSPSLSSNGSSLIKNETYEDITAMRDERRISILLEDLRELVQSLGLAMQDNNGREKRVD